MLNVKYYLAIKKRILNNKKEIKKNLENFQKQKERKK